MESIKMKINDLFNHAVATSTQQDEVNITQNPNNKQEGETYHHWGLRVCAIANGSNFIFTMNKYKMNIYKNSNTKI